MKKIIFILLLAVMPFAARAASQQDSLWNAGVECYANDDFSGALECFRALEDQGYSSAELYYNMGNTYFKMSGYIAYAVLYYERALKLDPSYKDARANLDFAHQFTLDKIEKVPEFVLVTWFKSFRETRLFSPRSHPFTGVQIRTFDGCQKNIFRFCHYCCYIYAFICHILIRVEE